jgi:hypothetical protein
MTDSGGNGKELIRPGSNRGILIDFPGDRITADMDFLLRVEVDDCANFMPATQEDMKGPRSPQRHKHSLVQLLRHYAHFIH